MSRLVALATLPRSRARRSTRAVGAEGLARERSKLCAMVSSEVQRTLVKSPPELWAEISDPDSLARHLGEFGEIRITRVHPEQRVEWESDDAQGTVAIKPSGWGTKVKLTVTRELVQPDEVAAEADLDAEANADAEAEAEANAEAEAEHEVALAADHPLDVLLDVEPPAREAQSTEEPPRLLEGEPELVPEPELEPEPEPQPHPELELNPQPRRGFFARLFGRRRSVSEALREAADLTERTTDDEAHAEAPLPAHGHEATGEEATGEEATGDSAGETAPTPSAPDADGAEEPLAPTGALDGAPHELEVVAADEEPDEEVVEEPLPDIAAEIRAAEEVAAEQVTAVLTGVLDRLGAAHHRPFSRS
jgi:DNA-binding protein YbaB